MVFKWCMMVVMWYLMVPGVPSRPLPCGAHRASGGTDFPRTVEPSFHVCCMEQKPLLVRGVGVGLVVSLFCCKVLPRNFRESSEKV